MVMLQLWHGAERDGSGQTARHGYASGKNKREVAIVLLIMGAVGEACDQSHEGLQRGFGRSLAGDTSKPKGELRAWHTVVICASHSAPQIDSFHINGPPIRYSCHWLKICNFRAFSIIFSFRNLFQFFFCDAILSKSADHLLPAYSAGCLAAAQSAEVCCCPAKLPRELPLK